MSWATPPVATARKGKAKKTSVGPSQRQLRVGEEIRHILADVLLRGHVASALLLGAHVTVTEVSVAPDLRNATAFVAMMGAEPEQVAAILAELNDLAPQFNHEVAQKLASKFSPRLQFASDERFDYAARIDALLRDTK